VPAFVGFGAKRLILRAFIRGVAFPFMARE